MAEALFIIGILAALLLIPLLLRTAWEQGFCIWPTPAPDSWQSIAFWTLFRTLNVTTIASAALTLTGQQSTLLGLPVEIRAVAGCIALVALFWYAHALMSLGKKNTYCDAEGLITRGIYRWTRNPQYATIIPFYVALAFAADTSITFVLSAAMCSVYYLMAMVEEPWLTEAYGKPYAEYCRRVPRFFNVHRVVVWVQAQLRAAQRRVSASQRL